MKYLERLKSISDTLRRSKKVNALDQGNEPDNLAHSFLDIEESCKTLLTHLFPKLHSNSLGEEELNDLLFDIGEELRHILYHIRTPKFYDYLKDKVLIKNSKTHKK